jgi:hypothetical protein
VPRELPMTRPPQCAMTVHREREAPPIQLAVLDSCQSDLPHVAGALRPACCGASALDRAKHALASQHVLQTTESHKP